MVLIVNKRSGREWQVKKEDLFDLMKATFPTEFSGVEWVDIESFFEDPMDKEVFNLKEQVGPPSRVIS